MRTDVQYEQVIVMRSILYFNFIGARAFYERRARGLKPDIPLAVVEDDSVIDCDEGAWLDGVRPGDTVRQAKIASPRCQIARIHGAGDSLTAMKEILDVLLKVTPYIEPSPDGNGVFLDVTPGIPVGDLMLSFQKITGSEGFPFYRVFAGENGTKLLAKAACQHLSREYAEGGRIFPGKTPWGKVERRSGYILASVDRGKEKLFLSNANIECLWPAPPDVLGTLRSLGLKKVKEVREVPLSGLSRHLGDWAFLVKKWVEGEDRSLVKALYPPPCIVREVNYAEPVMLAKEIFKPAVKSLADELIEKEIGFRSMRLLASGDFPAFSRERKFLRPVSSEGALSTAINAMIDEVEANTGVVRRPVDASAANGAIDKSIGNTEGDMHLSISGFSIQLSEVAPAQVRPLSLLVDGERLVSKAVPVSLGLAISGIERKFGGEALSWGCSGDPETGFTPEIARREKMLSVWDPMRPEFGLGGEELCQR